MKLKENFAGKEALVIVAHPDDETIWSGGLLATQPGLNWTILCLSRASDPARAPKFRRVGRHYRAKAIIADLPDDGKLSLEQLTPLAEQTILKVLGRYKAGRFDLIFTHGKNGEYGHLSHRAVYRAVRKLVQKNKLKTGRLYCFNYKKGRRPAAKKNSDLVIHLTAGQFRQKKAVMTKLYGFDPDGIDANYCTNPEAFKILRNKQLAGDSNF